MGLSEMGTSLGWSGTTTIIGMMHSSSEATAVEQKQAAKAINAKSFLIIFFLL
jgi:hypothetical protein